MKNDVVKFCIVMPWGRVGSNLVVDILRQLTRCPISNEPLNLIRDNDKQKEWYSKEYILKASHDYRYIGTKLSLVSIVDKAWFSARFTWDGVRVVRMRRDNIVKAALSQIRGELFAEKTRREEGRARWGLHPGESGLGQVDISFDLLLKRIQIMERAHQELLTAFDGCKLCDIEYTELANNIDDVVRKACNFLEVAYGPYKIRYIKATPNNLKDAIG